MTRYRKGAIYQLLLYFSSTLFRLVWNTMDKDGPKLLASRIDWYANNDPTKPVASIPRDHGDLSRGYRDISYQVFASAIDRASWWLDDHLSNDETDKLTHPFTYYGPVDLRWLIFFVAGIKTSRKMLLAVSNASVPSVQHLFNATQCTTALHSNTQDTKDLIEKFLKGSSIQCTLAVPELAELLSSEPCKPYIYSKTFDQTADDAIAILHTSGTTGLPKPLYYTNRMIYYWIALRRLHAEDPHIQLAAPIGSRLHSTFFIGYGGGMYFNLFSAVASNTVTVFPSPEDAYSLESVKQVLRYGEIDTCAYSPATVSAIANDSEGLELLRSKAKTVTFGGAPVDDATAIKITQNGGPELCNCYGSVEMEMLPAMKLEGHEWPYFSFHPYSGINMVPIGEQNELCECVIKRDAHFKDYQPVFCLHHDLDEYHTRDLFSVHPSSKEMWKYRGRVDDVVILGTAQNLYTADMRQAIEEHPAISAAIVGGQGMRRPFVLVELHQGEFERFDKNEDDVIEAIWPHVKNANRVNYSLEHAHLTKDAVLIANARRSFLRTGKGTVNRIETLKEFEADVKKIPGISMT